MKHKTKILPFLALLSTLCLLFAPLIEVVHSGGDHSRTLTIYGWTIAGDTEHLQGVSFAQELQLLALLTLLLSLVVALFTRQRIRLLALTVGVFIISMIPVWMMVYVEDIIKHQTQGFFDHHYAYGMAFAMISLLCITFSIVNIQLHQKTQSQRILDADWD
ncbi:MAG TPA: hypothetical protein VJ933_10250 [Phaeodactylibacter sp.]|nr:hypothetical protein [Phaeodactylibacter sp.]